MIGDNRRFLECSAEVVRKHLTVGAAKAARIRVAEDDPC